MHARVIRPLLALALPHREAVAKPPAEREAEARRECDSGLQGLFEDSLVSRQMHDPTAIEADVNRDVNEAALQALARGEAAEVRAQMLWVYSPDVEPASSAFDQSV